MEKCKFCQAEMTEGVTLCPACGKDNAQEASVPVMENIPETMPVVEDIPETTPVLETAPEAVPVVEIPQTIGEAEAAASEEAAKEAAEESAEEAAEDEETAEEAAEETAEEAKEEPAAEEETSEEAPKSQATPGKVALAVAAIVLLLALLVALIVTGMKGREAPEAAVPAETAAAEVPATVPADGAPGTVTEKGTYTVSDEEAKASGSQVVATIGDRVLTNADLQVYYWMEVKSFLNNYGAYAMYFGLDYTQPLDTQMSLEETPMTWQQYFLQCALNNWQQIQSMQMEAEKAGLPISDEDQAYLDSIPTSLQESATAYGMTLEDLLLINIGPGAGLEDFVAFQTCYRHGVAFYDSQVATFVPTVEDLEAYYAAHEADYAAAPLDMEAMGVTVRHVLLAPTSTTTDGTYSEADWEACRVAAQALLDSWKEGEKTEESFGLMANEHSVDGGSNTNGGLYKDFGVGKMVQPFNDWCFDASRKSGDTGLVKTDYGYHIMYYVSTRPMWQATVENDWINDKINTMFDNLLVAYPMTVDYSKIVLGYVPLGG